MIIFYVYFSIYKTVFQSFSSWTIIKSTHLKVGIYIRIMRITYPNPCRIGRKLVYMIVVDKVNINYIIDLKEIRFDRSPKNWLTRSWTTYLWRWLSFSFDCLRNIRQHPSQICTIYSSINRFQIFDGLAYYDPLK